MAAKISKKILISIIGILLLLIFVAFISKFNQTSFDQTESSKEEQKTTITAGFSIYTQGIKRDFSNPMYHNQSDSVYITSENPGIIIVTKKGITWGDFFETLPMNLSEECLITGTGQTFCTNTVHTLSFFINGEPADNFLETEIQNRDQALINYGNEELDELKLKIQEEREQQLLNPAI